MNIKHIYWFAYFNLNEPSVRYRAKYPLENLQKEYGIMFSIVYPGYDFINLTNFILTYFSVLFFRKQNSVIVYQKIYTNGIYATALKILLCLRPSYTLYDIDDAEYTRRPTSTIHFFLKNCWACSTGSQSLLKYASALNKNVFLLTSPILQHEVVKSRNGSRFTVGWIGYYGAHRKSLHHLLFPALKKVDFPVLLKILGVKDDTDVQEIKNYFSGTDKIQIEAPTNINWFDEHSIYKTISEFDVGVSPLVDSEFNRAKSTFKLKQYLSCGVPVLGSNVGKNNAFLIHGINGYLCSSADDFYTYLMTIKETDTKTYTELSKNSRSSLTEFNMSNYCSTLLQNCSLYR